MSSQPFLDIQGLYASFRGQSGDLDALGGVSLQLARGEFVCLVGPSGCGKSTLLRIVAGLLEPSAGQVQLESAPLREPGRRVGLVFQQPTLLPWRTVYGNIALPLELLRLPPEEIRQQTHDLITLVGLAGFEDAYPLHLSGGMAQRTAIARALAQNPELLLLDEPFASLDALTRERMAAELLRIWQQYQRTVLMVTHNVEEAALLADRVVVMGPRPGRVVGIVPVTLPRPRSPALLTTPQLQAIALQLREALCLGDADAPQCRERAALDAQQATTFTLPSGPRA